MSALEELRLEFVRAATVFVDAMSRFITVALATASNGARAPQEAPTLIDTAELARQLGISRASIARAMAADPDFPKVRIGTRLRFDLAEVRRHFDRRGRQARAKRCDRDPEAQRVIRRAGLRLGRDDPPEGLGAILERTFPNPHNGADS